VIYHGKGRWRAPRNFHDLIAPLPTVLAPFVPRFTYALHDISARTNAEIKGAVLTRLVQLAMRWIFSKEPLARLGDLLTLIEQVEDRTTALEILESLLRYYVQGTGRVEERDVRALLEQNPTGDPIMQTFIDRYIEQGRQAGRQEGRQEGGGRYPVAADRPEVRPPERDGARTHQQRGPRRPAALVGPHPHRGQSGRYATLICTGDGLRKKRGTFPRSHYSRRVGLGYGSGQP